MNNLIKELEDKVKQEKYYAVRFGIEANDYLSEDNGITFGDNTTFTQCGNKYNYQPIIKDGMVIGTLEEFYSYNILMPPKHSFLANIKDGYTFDSEHFYDEEFGNVMGFATLDEFVKFYNENKDKIIVFSETEYNKL